MGGGGFGGGTSGGFGGGGTGLGGGMGAGGGMGGMGSSSSTGAFGQRTLGAGAGAGRSNFGTGQAMGFNNLSSVGTTPGANFRAQSFIGADPSLMGALIGAGLQGAGGTTGMNGQYGGMNGQFGGTSGQYGQNNRRNQNQMGQNGMNRGGGNSSGTTSKAVSTTYYVDFDHPSISSSKVATKLSTELSQSKSISALGPITVQMEGRSAILRGIVGSEHERSLAERLALLEPGVSQVQNELQIPSRRPEPTSESKTESPDSRTPELSPPVNSR
jgi:hypothetical protein